MTPKQKIEAFIVCSGTTIYYYLVCVKIAQVEGFVVLITYIIKKFLDMLEKEGDDVIKQQNGGKKE